MADNLTWFAARALVRKGKAIRRVSWTKWLVRGEVLWYLVTVVDAVESRSVVAPTEFKSTDFLATDWTDTAITGAGQPPVGTPWTAQPGGSGNFGSLINRPAVISLFQPTAGTGGIENPRPVFAHNPPAGGSYALSVEIVEPVPIGESGLTIYVRVAITGGPALPILGTLSVYFFPNGWSEELFWTSGTGGAYPGFQRLIPFRYVGVNPGDTVYARAVWVTSGPTLEAADQVQMAVDEPGFDLEAVDLSNLVADLSQLTRRELVSTDHPFSLL